MQPDDIKVCVQNLEKKKLNFEKPSRYNMFPHPVAVSNCSYEISIRAWFHCEDTNDLYVSFFVLTAIPPATYHTVMWFYWF